MSQALSLTTRPANPVREGLNALFRLKRPIILLCVLLPCAAIGLGFALTPIYEADSSVMVKTGREFSAATTAGDGMTIPPAVTKQEIVNSEVEILQSHKLADDTIEAIGLATIFPDIAAGDDSPERKNYVALKAFDASLYVKPVKLSNVLNIAFRNENRGVSEQVLSTLLKLYLAQHVRVFSEPRVAGLDTALQQYTDEVRNLERQRTDILVKYDLSAADHQREAIITEQATIDDRLHTLRDHAIEAEGKVRFYQEQLAHTPRLVTAQTSTSDAIEKARSELVDLKLKESELAAHFQEGTPPLAQVRDQMKVMGQFLARNGSLEAHVLQATNPLYDDLALSLSRAQADLRPDPRPDRPFRHLTRRIAATAARDRGGQPAIERRATPDRHVDGGADDLPQSIGERAHRRTAGSVAGFQRQRHFAPVRFHQAGVPAQEPVRDWRARAGHRHFRRPVGL